MGSSSTPPHFFKVILPQTLTQQMLDVPKKYMRKYGETLKGEEVCLKVVNGTVWKIGLKKIDKKVWLEKGWNEFVKFHSIVNGHFVVFKYEGNSCFQVLIFDKTATGIDYPTPSRQFKNQKVFENEEIKGFKMKAKRERKEFEENERSRDEKENGKWMKRRSDEASGSKAIICESHDLKIVEVNNIEDLQILDLEAELENKMRLSLKKKEASKFKLQIKNPSFLVTIGFSYLPNGRGNVCIPVSFGNSHLRGIDEFTLQVSNDKAWKIKCVERYHSPSTNRFEMRNGWKIFARDNNLKEDDICVFELIKNIQISFHVTIFRSGL